MKVIIRDNFDREDRSDRLYLENLTEEKANEIVRNKNLEQQEDSEDFYVAVPDEYKLYDHTIIY